MIDYNSAKAWFEANSAKMSHGFIELPAYGFMCYDKDNDVFKIMSPVSRYAREGNHWRELGLNEMEMRHKANIYKTHAEVFDVMNSEHLLKEYWGVKVGRSRTRHFKGKVLRQGLDKVFCDPDKPVEFWNGRITPNCKPTKRVFNKERQKAMNDLIAKVRKDIKLRVKLGAFKDWDANPQAIIDEHAQRGLTTVVLRSPSRFLELLRKVDPMDLDTFKPIYAAVISPAWRADIVAEPFDKAFVDFVKARREEFRELNDEVSYVEVDS